jgi:hypothetical protein
MKSTARLINTKASGAWEPCLTTIDGTNKLSAGMSPNLALSLFGATGIARTHGLPPNTAEGRRSALVAGADWPRSSAAPTRLDHQRE